MQNEAQPVRQQVQALRYHHHRHHTLISCLCCSKLILQITACFNGSSTTNTHSNRQADRGEKATRTATTAALQPLSFFCVTDCFFREERSCSNFLAAADVRISDAATTSPNLITDKPTDTGSRFGALERKRIRGRIAEPPESA